MLTRIFVFFSSRKFRGLGNIFQATRHDIRHHTSRECRVPDPEPSLGRVNHYESLMLLVEMSLAEVACM